MGFAIIPAILGLICGLARGGRPRHMRQWPFRATPLLAVGLTFQVLFAFVHVRADIDVAAMVSSYGLLLAFAIANFGRPGLGLVMLGIALNLAPITIDGGMPVRPSALVAAHVAEPDKLALLDLGGKRHLSRRGDRFTLLSDIIPDPVFREVLSFGDLVVGVGIAAAIANLLQRPRPAPDPARSSGPDEIATAVVREGEMGISGEEAQPATG